MSESNDEAKLAVAGLKPKNNPPAIHDSEADCIAIRNKFLSLYDNRTMAPHTVKCESTPHKAIDPDKEYEGAVPSLRGF